MNEIKPIELSMSEDLKKYLDFIKLCQQLWEEEMKTMMITSGDLADLKADLYCKLPLLKK